MSDAQNPVIPQTKNYNRNVMTTMMDREEVFRFLAVGEATKLPALLVGVAGTGKTKSVTDYAKAYYRLPGMSEVQVGTETLKNTFILEVDEGSRPAEVKGRVDMEKLLVQHTYHVNSPITEAKFVLINEIDKSTPGLRNSLLGVMNEKFLFNGKEKVHCKWDVFLATCNVIPPEEKDSPFWDRFVLKMEVKRISKGMMQKYWTNLAAKTPPKQLPIKIPTEQELAGVRISDDHLAKFMEVCYSSLSDRTLSHVPRVVAAITFIYRMPVTRALVKAAEMLTDYSLGKKLAGMLEPKEVMEIRNKIELVMTLTDRTSLQTTLTDIQNSMNSLIKSGVLTQDSVDELKDEITLAIENNPLSKQNPVASPFQQAPSAATQPVAQAAPIIFVANTTAPNVQVRSSGNSVEVSINNGPWLDAQRAINNGQLSPIDFTKAWTRTQASYLINNGDVNLDAAFNEADSQAPTHFQVVNNNTNSPY